MSGHSKWKTIKHKKAASDAKKSKAFTKIIKEITVSTRLSGGDPAHNPTLRTLLEKARRVNMPQDNIVRAIKKGTGELPGMSYEEYHYEGYGPGGIAVIVDVLTDNKNRAVSEIRSLFTRKGGSLAENGAVSWMFERAGVVRCAHPSITEDQLIEALLEFEIRDIERDKEEKTSWTISCDPHDLDKVREALKQLGMNIEEAEIEMLSKTPHSTTENQEQQAIEFLDALEELEDVQNVYTNLA